MEHQPKARVVIAGMGDSGVVIATQLASSCEVVGIATRMALVNGQELGSRLTRTKQWRDNYFVPFSRFKKLDDVSILHGRVGAVDFDRQLVHVHLADGSEQDERYDVLVIATGTTNGFWRGASVEGTEEISARIEEDAASITRAQRIAIVGGGPSAVSAADNIALSSRAEVHLFYPDALLGEYHPRARRWAEQRLRRDGVHLHPGHRAVIPEQHAQTRLTQEAIVWQSGQEPFKADVVLWATGKITPNSGFLPASLLDIHGFVMVDQTLRLPGHPNVFAIGDIAASDPLRSSARNWGWRVVVANVKTQAKGGTQRLRRFRAPSYRWGSLFGFQDHGLTVVQPTGRRFRIPRFAARHLLSKGFIQRYLCGGLRPPS